MTYYRLHWELCDTNLIRVNDDTRRQGHFLYSSVTQGTHYLARTSQKSVPRVTPATCTIGPRVAVRLDLPRPEVLSEKIIWRMVVLIAHARIFALELLVLRSVKLVADGSVLPAMDSVLQPQGHSASSGTPCSSRSLSTKF